MTAHHVRIGVQLQPHQAAYSQIRDATLRLEDMGVDVVTTWDHFFPLLGDPDGANYESWTLLAAIAEQTERIEFGHMVNCTLFRNADLQADMARTIDHISAKAGGVGRFIYGAGAGWFERDFIEYGYDFPAPGARLGMMEDTLVKVTRRWALLSPTPTREIPILIGGGGERKTLRIVAKYADWWNTSADPETLEHKLSVLREWGRKVGRDVDTIGICVDVADRTPAEADRFLALGARLFSIKMPAVAFDPQVITQWLRWRDRRQL